MRSSLAATVIALLTTMVGLAQPGRMPSSTADRRSQGDREAVLAILYQQNAAEYAALCLQAYNLAKRKVDAALADPTIMKSDTPLAVITDLDETVLDNSANEVRQYLADSLYDPGEFNRWAKSEQADTVPGSLAFFKYVDSLSKHSGKRIDIYYISNRDDSVLTATRHNMQRLGYPQCEDTMHFKFKWVGTSSSKEGRRQQVKKDHRVIVLLGDNLIDLDAAFDGYTQSPVDRFARVYNLREKWGDSYIVLPNAIYGDWESYLYYQFRLNHKGVPPSDLRYIEEQRKGLLKAPAKGY